jgi:peptide/nickel transport system permease protein
MTQFFLRRFFKKKSNVIALGFSLALILIAIFGSSLTPYNPLKLYAGPRFSPPSTQNWLGTDNLGRDLTSRVMAGAGLALQSSLIILVSALIVGTLVGLIAGYYGGWIDEVLMRITDVFIAFPGLVLAMAISAALGPSLMHAMIAIAVVWWPSYARLVRGLVLSLREREFVQATRALGSSNTRILFKHILPNILIPLVIQLTLDLGPVLVTSSTLSFIGMGVQPPAPEWGSMVSYGRKYLLDYWWISTFPGAAIFITVLILNGLGESVRKALSFG